MRPGRARAYYAAIAAACALMLAGGLAASCTGEGGVTYRTIEREARPSQMRAAPRETAPAFGEPGLYMVGRDISPGEYEYTAHVSRAGGYYARCSDAACSGDSIIADALLGSSGVLHVFAGDRFVYLGGVTVRPAGS